MLVDNLKNKLMEKQRFEGIYLFLISILPISIIVGPSISLLNILLIVIVFLINFKLDKIKFDIFLDPYDKNDFDFYNIGPLEVISKENKDRKNF